MSVVALAPFLEFQSEFCLSKRILTSLRRLHRQTNGFCYFAFQSKELLRCRCRKLNLGKSSSEVREEGLQYPRCIHCSD